MALALQTFPTVKDANAALKAAGTRYLGGGTLVVRAANEGDVSVSGLVMSTDPALSAIAAAGGKVRIGASVTMAAIARHPDLGPLAKAARAVGTMVHTAPNEAGQVLALVKPRLAVVYHFFNDFDTGGDIEREIRRGRKFSLNDALGRLGGEGMLKGASPVPPIEQTEAAIANYLRAHLADPGGVLAHVMARQV